MFQTGPRFGKAIFSPSRLAHAAEIVDLDDVGGEALAGERTVTSQARRCSTLAS